MYRRVTTAALTAAAVLALAAPAADTKPTKADLAKTRKALQEVQEFVGVWKMNGTPKGGKGSWTEEAEWAWRFDKVDKDVAWIAVKFDKGKFYAGGDLTYLPATKKYQLTLTPAAAGAKPEVLEGDLIRGTLTLTGKDAAGDVLRLKVNTAAEGARMLAALDKQDKGKGPFTEVYKQDGTKAGESFAGGAKKPECIVTGGSATIAVSHGGKTYYVCCSGCRDEFNANPEKFIKEAAKKK